MSEIEQALQAAAAVGPFFELHTGRTRGESDPPGPWRAFRELYDGSQVLPHRIAAVRGVLAGRAGTEPAGIDERAAASLVHLGFVARLISPPVGTALLGGMLLDLDPDRLSWRDVLGPVPLAHPGLHGRRVDPSDAAAISAYLADLLVAGPPALLGDAVAGTGVSDQVLNGNVASATAAALVGIVRAVPRVRAEAGALLTALLGGPLHGQGELEPGGGFRRSSCCLYYRVPGGGYCGDCVLAKP